MYILYPCRLEQFSKDQNYPVCGENANFGGKCITAAIAEELWKFYYEVCYG